MLPAETRQLLLEDPGALPNTLSRAVGWLALWDALLDGEVTAPSMLEAALIFLESDADPLLTERILDDLRTAFWRVATEAERENAAERLEASLWRKLQSDPANRASTFQAYVDIARTPKAVGRLEKLWRLELEIPGLPLAEKDFRLLALELGVREIEGWRKILDEQTERITQPDRKAQFLFVRPALDADPETRGRFFASLGQAENRAREPWVLEALEYLHHPLRAETSEAYLQQSLEWLEEIQRTGDIFFPKRWLDRTFAGHRSAEAAATVRTFLAERPDYPKRLRGKILQASDILLRVQPE